MPNATVSRVRPYLDELERALSGLPKDRRSEIVRDIRGHIDVALAERGEPTAADVEQVLEELGTPQEIAEAAYAELPPAPTKMAGLDIAAVVLLLVGGFLLLIGWVVGVILLWVSDTWSTRDKVVATLLVPGGLLTPFLFTGLAALTTVTSCSGSPQPLVAGLSASATTASVVTSHCSSVAGAGQGVVIFTWVTLAIAVIGPIYTAAMLIRAARRVS